MTKWLLGAALLVAAQAHADSDTEHSLSVGAGYQYGGLLGAKLGLQSDNHVLYGSLGLIGAAAGYQYLVDENKHHAFGVSVGSEVVSSEDGFLLATYDFYLNGYQKPGFHIGINAGTRREDSASFWANNEDSQFSTVVSLSVGYKFY